MSDPIDYRITVQRRDTEDGRLFEGTVDEFPDLAVFGETADEAYALVIDAIDALCSLLSEQRRPIPKPSEPEREFSGKFVVRVPKWLHRDLAQTAETQGTSLNQYVLSILSAHTGITKPATQYVMGSMRMPQTEWYPLHRSASTDVALFRSEHFYVPLVGDNASLVVGSPVDEGHEPSVRKRN